MDPQKMIDDVSCNVIHPSCYNAQHLDSECRNIKADSNYWSEDSCACDLNEDNAK